MATSRSAADGVDGRRHAASRPARRSAGDRLVAEERPDAIIHQATALSRIGNNLRRFDRYFETTNRLRTAGTATLIEAAEAYGRPRLIVQSFCGWPAAAVGGPVKTEEDPLDPTRPSRCAGRWPDQGSGAAGQRMPTVWCCATAASTVRAPR